MRLTLFVVLLLFPFFAQSQQATELDSTFMLSYEDYIKWVADNHPMAQQSQLRVDAAKAQYQRSLGAFDPKIEAGIDQKYFQEKPYYSYENATIKMATPFALELKAGYDLNSGYYLSEENKTPDDGLLIAGASLPLLQGLLIDERRAIKQQAEIIREFSEAEKKAVLFQLYTESRKAYWEWWNTTERLKVAEEMLSLAEQRFLAVRDRAVIGDRPIIDTVDAYLNRQLRVQQLQEARIIEVKARAQVSSFLWKKTDDDTTPIWLSEKVRPSSLDSKGELVNPNFLYSSAFAPYLENISTTNPEVQLYQSKIAQLEVEERWKREKLKPKLNLEYNFLSESFSSPEGSQFSTNNYKWGGSFSMPILLREARGDLKLQRIKIQDTEWTLDQKINQLQFKARSGSEVLNTLLLQLAVIDDNLLNYQKLLEAERTRFFNGESSLLLVNLREQFYTEAQMKRLDTILKIKQQELDVQLALGQF
ncbi:MAG: TolC family protein [Flavobacteriales bacterium]